MFCCLCTYTHTNLLILRKVMGKARSKLGTIYNKEMEVKSIRTTKEGETKLVEARTQLEKKNNESQIELKDKSLRKQVNDLQRQHLNSTVLQIDLSDQQRSHSLSNKEDEVDKDGNDQMTVPQWLETHCQTRIKELETQTQELTSSLVLESAIVIGLKGEKAELERCNKNFETALAELEQKHKEFECEAAKQIVALNADKERLSNDLTKTQHDKMETDARYMTFNEDGESSLCVKDGNVRLVLAKWICLIVIGCTGLFLVIVIFTNVWCCRKSKSTKKDQIKLSIVDVAIEPKAVSIESKNSDTILIYADIFDQWKSVNMTKDLRDSSADLFVVGDDEGVTICNSTTKLNNSNV